MSNSPTAVRAVLAVAAVRSHSRRQLLQGGMVAAGFSLLSGREVIGQPAADMPRIGFLAVGSREGFRTLLIDSPGIARARLHRGQNIVI
jgi:hypothetical protein